MNSAKPHGRAWNSFDLYPLLLAQCGDIMPLPCSQRMALITPHLRNAECHFLPIIDVMPIYLGHTHREYQASRWLSHPYGTVDLCARIWYNCCLPNAVVCCSVHMVSYICENRDSCRVYWAPLLFLQNPVPLDGRLDMLSRNICGQRRCSPGCLWSVFRVHDANLYAGYSLATFFITLHAIAIVLYRTHH